MGLKLLVAARDGVIDNREIDAILDNLNAVYDVVLVASTLLFAGLFGFFFSSPPTPDEWLSEDLVDKLQWAFLVLNGIAAGLFLAAMAACMTLKMHMSYTVTTEDKARG